jgi:DNA polymerase-3 subunit alpha
VIGQGSIFDLGLAGAGGAEASAAAAFAGPGHAPIPAEEFSRSELLAAEKESIGLFITAHPLKEIGAALRARSDSTLAELSTHRDGDWVTIGGMVTHAKRIKTKKSDWMMFATVYDLESSVEIIVFDKALSESADALVTDSIVLVRGRVDHKDGDKTCVVAQQVERFEPSQDEVAEAHAQAAKQVLPPTPLRLRIDATSLPATMLGDLKDLLAGFPGESDVVVELSTTIGARRLRLGPSFRVRHSAGLHAELDSLLGSALIDDSAAAAPINAAAGVA